MATCIQTFIQVHVDNRKEYIARIKILMNGKLTGTVNMSKSDLLHSASKIKYDIVFDINLSCPLYMTLN